MSNLNDIVSVNISRQSTSVARASFGVFGIIAEFATNKTTTTFARTRYYASLAEMTADGWGVYDPVYMAAQKVFSQNPKVERILVGRKDSGDLSFAAALAAIQNEEDNWYMFTYVDAFTSTLTMSADFVTGNSIVMTINGVALGAVSWSTNQQTTMGLLKTAIEAGITGATFTVGSTPFRTATLVVAGKRATVSMAVTGGASQPTMTYTEASDIVDQDIKDIAAWTETEQKMYTYNASAAAIYDAGSTSDIAYFLKAQGYTRTFGVFYKDSAVSNIESAWAGEALPYDPGSQTWAFKQLAGVSAYGITAAQRTAILAKNINIYTTTAGVDITEEGKVASGEYIDIIIGLDWLQANLQEEVFSNLVNIRKIPYDDTGITMIAGIVQGVLESAVNAGILQRDSVTLTVPKYADISSADKTARNLPDVTFTALLQGAIQGVEINGTVSV